MTGPIPLGVVVRGLTAGAYGAMRRSPAALLGALPVAAGRRRSVARRTVRVQGVLHRREPAPSPGTLGDTLVAPRTEDPWS